MKGITRRNFLKKSALVTAAVGLGAPSIARAEKTLQLDSKFIECIRDIVIKFYKHKSNQAKRFKKVVRNHSEFYFKGAGKNDEYVVVTLDEIKSDPMRIYSEGKFCRSETEAKRVTNDYKNKGLIALYLQKA